MASVSYSRTFELVSPKCREKQADSKWYFSIVVNKDLLN